MRELQAGSGIVDESDEEIEIDYSENSESASQENEDGGFFDGEEGLSDVDVGQGDDEDEDAQDDDEYGEEGE
jgi:hypothetical protein